MNATRAQTATALGRLERVLVMVPWLLEHQGATFAEIAERFGATTEEVAADLDILGYCGLPGYGGGDLVEVTTFGDAVTVRMADFFNRPLRLSLREAITLLLAARTLAQVEGLPESGALARALTRLEALVRASSTLDHGAVRVAMDLRAEGDDHIAGLRDAIAARRLVRMTYRSASKAETTTREVEPWSVVGAAGAWYLRGYCRLADAPRDFRLDRIADLTLLETPIPPRPRGDTAEGGATGEGRAGEAGAGAGGRGAGDAGVPGYRPSERDHEVEVELRRPAWWFADQLVVDEVIEDGEWHRIRLRVREMEWLARRLLILGDDVRILRPDALAQAVAVLASRLRSRYEDTAAM